MKLPKEKAFLGAIDVLYYSPGEKLARDTAYSEALAAMYAHVAGRSRSGDVVRAVAARHRASDRSRLPPPGARRVDCAEGVRGEPEASRARRTSSFTRSTIRITRRSALPAARSYAGIAPSAAHALHMPSHIFVQRGMWADVAHVEHRRLQGRHRSQRAHEARRGPRGLPHARLAAVRQPDARQHRRGEAERRVGEAGRRSQSDQRRHSQRLPRHARAADSRNGEVGEDRAARRTVPAARGGARCARRHAGHGDARRATSGFSSPVTAAAKRGDLKTAEAAEAQLRGAREKLEAGQNAFNAKYVAVMEKQVGALVRSARGQKDEALKLAKEAMDIELSLSAPSGPPDPIKPAPEFYGELLIRGRKTRGSRCRTWNFRCSGPLTGRHPSKPCSGPARRARQCDNYGNPKLRLRTLDAGSTYEETCRPGARRR